MKTVSPTHKGGLARPSAYHVTEARQLRHGLLEGGVFEDRLARLLHLLWVAQHFLHHVGVDHLLRTCIHHPQKQIKDKAEGFS